MRHFRFLRASDRFRANLWAVPLLFSVLAFILERRMVMLDRSLRMPAELNFDAGTASQLLTAIMGAMISFLGIVFAFFVLVLQSATSQLSPRILVLWYRDRKLKATLGIISAALIYNFLLMGRMRAGFVPSISIGVAGLLGLSSIVAFLAFLDHVARNIRPAIMADIVARQGLQAAGRVYRPLGTKAAEPLAQDEWPAGRPLQTVTYTGRGRVLRGLDTERLVADARQAGCVLVFCVAVGDFMRTGAPLVRVYGGAPLSEKQLRRRMALGPEQQLDMDPAYAFRLLVDIGTRALSPGINDPTTAVQMLDRIGMLLHDLANRDLDAGILRDQDGHLRVLLSMPRWEDFLRLGLEEIRHYGRGASPVTRRLRALLEELAEAVPAERRPAVEHELGQLIQSTGVSEGDHQGLGPSRSLPVPPALH